MLKMRLGLSPRFVTAELGPEMTNPRYRPVPPMQFVAPHGAQLEARHWKMVAEADAAKGRRHLYQ